MVQLANGHAITAERRPAKAPPTGDPGSVVKGDRAFADEELAEICRDLQQATQLLVRCQARLAALTKQGGKRGPTTDKVPLEGAAPKAKPPATVATEITGRPRPTDEQAAVLARAGEKVVKVVAMSGTGKSTTLRFIAEQRKKERGLYLAYNKSIALEAAASFPRTVDCKTAHALAFQIQDLKRHRGKVVNKIYPDSIADLVSWPAKELSQTKAVLLNAVINAIGLFCNSTDPEISTGHVVIDGMSERLWVADTAKAIWQKMTDLQDLAVPMTHDGYLKRWQLKGGGASLKYDYLMIDEAQDLNPVIAEIIATFDGGVVYVGDPYQQIYGFRGAVNALDQIEAESLYLTQSWRFGASVAALANKILSYALTKPAREIIGNASVKTEILPKGRYGTLISRTNATLFEAAATATGSVHIIGGFDEIADLALGAQALFGGRRAEVKHPALRRFRNWSELVNYVEAVGDPELTRVIKLIDRYGSDIGSMVDSVKQRLCEEKKADLVLGTGHKVKGREFDTVGVAGDFAHPVEIVSERERNPSPQLEEELNLLYVTVTRARARLILPPSLYDLCDLE